MILFETRNVSKSFSNHRALDKVSITVPEGSIYGLLGPNGAGKTTLIRIINQITGPDEGELLLNGRKLKPDDVFNIGYLPEERGLYKKMKVGEQALYLAQLKGLSKAEALKRLKIWFEKFDIVSWWNRKVEELSKGMQQKIQFIVTVIHQPKLLIFDEPFSGFDPINAELLKNEILDLRNKGATIIFSTHNMASVEEVCSHIALINRSRKVLEGDIHEIKDTYRTQTYRVKLKDCSVSPEEILNGRFQLLNKEQKNGNTELTVKGGEGVSSNDLLKTLMHNAQLTGFEEIMPSMNEIFLNVVGGDAIAQSLTE